MSLRKTQSDFAAMTIRLMQRMLDAGYEITYGDAYRDPRVHGPLGAKKGYSHSLSGHKLKLALDLNLFKDGKYLTDTESHRQFGEWWKQQDERARWGGDIKSGDGNHYSFDASPWGGADI